MRLLICALMLFTASTARADQCLLVEPDVATWAVKVMPKGSTVAQWCEKCGEKSPRKPESVTGIEVRTDGADREVMVNGGAVDLAYVYVRTGKTTWSNVAALVGCPTNGVKPFTTINVAPVAFAVPSDCSDYKKATGDLLASCKKLTAGDRKKFQDALDTTEKAWMKPGLEQTKLATACKTAGDAIRRAAKICSRPDAPALGAMCSLNSDCIPNFCCTMKDGSGDRLCVRSTSEGSPGTCNK